MTYTIAGDPIPTRTWRVHKTVFTHHNCYIYIYTYIYIYIHIYIYKSSFRPSAMQSSMALNHKSCCLNNANGSTRTVPAVVSRSHGTHGLVHFLWLTLLVASIGSGWIWMQTERGLHGFRMISRSMKISDQNMPNWKDSLTASEFNLSFMFLMFLMFLASLKCLWDVKWKHILCLMPGFQIPWISWCLGGTAELGREPRHSCRTSQVRCQQTGAAPVSFSF